MQKLSLADLISRALPLDVKIDNILQSFPKDLTTNENIDLVAHILRECKYINWKTYIDNYEDLKNADVDPVIHFLKHGIFEGRKLFSQTLTSAGAVGNDRPIPKVSIIVPNYNNALYIEKCLSSLVAQTLKEIEIIVVDDGSTDDSLKLANQVAQNDPRILIIKHEKNESLHMARKTGVQAASGNYIMFCDPDDYLTLDACEKAYRSIIKGYDIVAFKIRIINHGIITPLEERKAQNWFNKISEGIYYRYDILNKMIMEGELPVSLCAKIGSTKIYKDAFSELEDGYFSNWEDLYEFLAIASKVKNLLVIGDVLYNYNRGVGGSNFDCSEEKCLRYMKMGKIFKPIERFCSSNNLDNYIYNIKNNLIESSARALFGGAPEKFVYEWLNHLVLQFGLRDVVVKIMKLYYKNWDNVSEKLVSAWGMNNKRKNISNIGLVLGRGKQLDSGVKNIIHALEKLHLNIFLFYEGSKNRVDLKDLQKNLFFLGAGGENISDTEDALLCLYSTLQDVSIDCMLFLDSLDSTLLWKILMLKLMDVPSIVSVNLDINSELMQRNREYSHLSLIKLLRCADKVICNRLQTEIYLKAQSVNALFINDNMFNINTVAQKEINTIAIVGNFSDLGKRPRECLRVLQGINQAGLPAKMVFIGGFDTVQEEKSFFQCAQYLKVADKIILTGKVGDPVGHLAKCSILFSADFIDQLGNGVEEAKAMGIPVVIYEIGSYSSDPAAGIICTAQDDRRGAIHALTQLLRDGVQPSQEISRSQNERCYGNTAYSELLGNTLKNFMIRSGIRQYVASDYQNIIRKMGFYAGAIIPTD